MALRWPALALLLLGALLGVSLATEINSQRQPQRALSSSDIQQTIHTSAMAVVKERARLPCDVTSVVPEDRIVLILWYRGITGTPIYSFDARGTTVENGKHWKDEEVLKKRAYFHLLPGSTWGGPSAPGAHLELFPVKDSDQESYRCRVDYLLSPTKNTIINFTVIIPPEKPQIYNASNYLIVGKSDASIIGPYNEGEQLDLICKVTGGRPTPTVMWFVNEEAWQAPVTQEAPGVISATLTLPQLTRRHLHAVFECRAFNFNGSMPATATATLDMNFRPLNVTILTTQDYLSAGTEYELVCQSWGSRPSAIISWWKGGTTALKDALMTTSPDSNVTTSILKYRAEMTDSGKHLTCRAINQHILQSAREDSLRLNVYYKPVVTLQMGNNLNPDNIKEGDDVYFECHINANPVVRHVSWLHNGDPVEHRGSKGVLIQNQTLVLQGLSKDAAGLYTCKATNSEGEGTSQPVDLSVKYKPYCRRHSKNVYGTALHEPASVTCEVEASPGPVTFRWTFNNTSEHLPIPASAVTSKELVSVASYAPKSHLDYGTLLCWAFNSIGEQAVPCAFAIIPAGHPDPPKNCSIANQTTETIEVECVAGFDGGLPQTFYMEVYDSSTGALHRNMSSREPLFLLTALRPGLAFLMVTYAANAKGRSDKAELETFTLKVAEKRTGPPALLEFTPFLGIVLGVVLVIFLVVIVIIVVFKFRKPQVSRTEEGEAAGEEFKSDLENKPAGGVVLRARPKEGPSEAEDKDPDIIPPHADLMTYTNYEDLERGGGGGVGSSGGGGGMSQSQFGAKFEPAPPVRASPLQRNQADVGGELNYVELSLPPDNLPGGGYSDEDPCVYPSLGHRRSLCLNPPPPAPEDASDAAENIYATLGLRRGVGGGGGMRGMAGFTHHASNPNLYATLNYRRGVTTTTLNPSLYATLPHRRDVAGTAASSTSFASSISVNNINNTSPPGFRDLRRSFVGPLIRRPSESAV
ncbi:nephrin-like isoform X2 [Portunus trituberculatus]|uniref:nephrin-like isoform X2 n=1 Tax=Portunus trituberculatus TaxID=210409 RepID=UPI001E1D169C|nr:nephrin-like isoform X2 [Portunus trituberculatus]